MINSLTGSPIPIIIDSLYNKIESNITQLKILGEGNFDQKKNLLTTIVQQLSEVPINDKTCKFSNEFGRTMAHLRVTHSQCPLKIREELRELSKKMENIAIDHDLQRPRPIISPAIGKLKKAVHTISQMHGQMLKKGEADTLLREGKILSTEYWVEFLDKWHRHPAILNTYFNEWRSYGHCESIDFWTYLNDLEKQGSIVHPELFSENDQVQYLTREERKTYRCNLKINEQGNCEAITANGNVLGDGLYITVLGPDNEFYVASKTPGKFQHASFFSGEAVKSAGMFLIKEGVIKNFISQSGHYKPEMPEIFQALSKLEKSGVNISKIALLFGTGGEDKVEIADPGKWEPYLQFKEGKYKSATVKKEGLDDALEKLETITISDRLVFNFLKDYGGANINKDLDALDPVNGRKVHLAWINFKNTIAKDIGIITPSVTKESRLWSNHASSVEEIILDASLTMPGFKDECAKIANKVGAKMSYGPNDSCAVKTKESLVRKMETDAKQMGISPKESLKKIGDVLRGTVVVSDSKQIPLVVDGIKDYAGKNGGNVIFKNLWIEERATGYVGVHAKLYLPVINEKGVRSDKMMIVELQIHLDVIMDGSLNCIKEYSHGLYDRLRTGTIDPQLVNPISLTMYASALKPLADKLQIKKLESYIYK
ncbi:MAG: hypothetical protein H0V82_11730 [Candidatus Protochlamydia sp.]|nr:hypothetical protein [Candidatus Protochlamydia sp.]